MNNSDLIEQFESEIVDSNQLPYCQIHNPPNLALSQIEQLNSPWGWFIPSEQAELAKFCNTDDWQPIRLTFAEDTSNPRHVDGFLATHLRVVVLHQSNIEVQEKAQKGWRYCGLAYQHGQLTGYGELAYSDRQNYRLRTRYLLMFLDGDNQLLHSTPFQIGMNAGVGAAFGGELKQFRNDFETIFFSQLNKPPQKLSDRAHALTIFDFQLGLHKSEGKSPYIYPQQRQTPDKSSSLTRRNRTVELIHQPLESLIIPNASATGTAILNHWQQHQGFTSKDRDEVTASDESLAEGYQRDAEYNP